MRALDQEAWPQLLRLQEPCECGRQAVVLLVARRDFAATSVASRRVRASRSVPNCRGDCLGALSSAPDCNDKRGCEVCVHPEKRLARPCAEPLVTRLWIGAVNIGPLGQLWFSWRHCSFPGPSQSGFLGRLSSRKYWSGRQDLNLRPGQVALCPGCRRASIHGSVCASKPRPRNRFAAPGTAHSVRPPAGKPNNRHRLLRRDNCERPRGRCTAEQRDELAALHSTTSSVPASNLAAPGAKGRSTAIAASPFRARR